MPVTALNRVNPLARCLQALDNFWDVIGVDMTKTELTILVIFSDRVNEALL